VPPPPIPPNAGSLPEMLLLDEFDYRRVPDAIWWVNYWNRERVAIFGMEQVHSAGWASVREVDAGAMVMGAVEQPLDVTDPSHILALRSISERLSLRSVQEQHRLTKDAF
jgi:hypothetical protein